MKGVGEGSTCICKDDAENVIMPRDQQYNLNELNATLINNGVIRHINSQTREGQSPHTKHNTTTEIDSLCLVEKYKNNDKAKVFFWRNTWRLLWLAAGSVTWWACKRGEFALRQISHTFQQQARAPKQQTCSCSRWRASSEAAGCATRHPSRPSSHQFQGNWVSLDGPRTTLQTTNKPTLPTGCMSTIEGTGAEPHYSGCSCRGRDKQ